VETVADAVRLWMASLGLGVTFPRSKMQPFEWVMKTKIRRSGSSKTSAHFMPYQ
jgi:hypothetical protein